MILLRANRNLLVLRRHYSSSSAVKTYPRYYDVRGKTLAIRREEQSVWERRAPLSPTNVRKLVRRGVKVLVQPSNRRAYPMQAYSQAGATIQEDISDANLILGVKQVPIDSLVPNKMYGFFSHTIKAQEANMPLLDAILEKKIRLLDYERMTDETSQRIVAFGKYAGVAGMINILHGLGLRLLALGHHTPFMHIGPAHNYRNTGMARQAIRDAGYEIAMGAMPRSIGPLTFVFTGSGNVSQGAQEVFQEFPHEYVPPEMLHRVATHGTTNKLYACEVSRKDHIIHKDTGKYSAQDYNQNPANYISTFAKKIAPHASVIINGIYWAVNSPKLITIPDAKYLLQANTQPWLQNSPGAPTLPHRMLAICDISADPGGSIEFMNECTTIDNPFCLYDADQHKEFTSFKGPGVLVCSIDNMPTQLPRESTDFFGDLLMPYIPEMLEMSTTTDFVREDWSDQVGGAIVATNGGLTKEYEYIQELRMANRTKNKATVTEQSKRALVLGAGYVSEPLVEYLTRGSSNVSVTVASALKEPLDALASSHPGVEPILLDVIGRPDLLTDLIKSSDIVVSLLPYGLHPNIAAECIKNKVNMVTASYCSPALKALNPEAKAAGIVIVNEVGLDPGIDHLLAMECFDEIHSHGGKVEKFVSYCGGLPAPEASDNALRYKFSWSPRGVLLNTLSAATFLKDGEVVQIPEGGALLNAIETKDFLPGFNLEGYPNRDSLLYRELYGITEAKTILRGTLRFAGFANSIKGLQKLGLIDPNPHPMLHPNGPDISWRQLISHMIHQHGDIFYDNLKNLVLKELDGDEMKLDAVESLGLLEDALVQKMNTPLDTLSHFLSKKLVFDKGERDLIVMRHEVSILWPDGKRELRGINLVSYGDPNGYSAMAKCVGYPAAIATRMVLDGEIQQTGNVYPFTPDIYRPMLSRLRAEGIQAVEKSKFL